LVRENFGGQSIAHAEYWADTFDRWGEELVGPGEPDGGGESAEAPNGSLPPTIVLEVMKILEKEIGLRDETRAAEQAREIMPDEAYRERALSLAGTQDSLATRTNTVVTQISVMALEGLQFPKEIELLTRVEEVMREARGLLARPDTGPQSIAAETEAIELLLQAQRVKPSKAAGGSGDTPGGGGAGDTEEAALALIGRGEEVNAGSLERTPTQATGSTGADFPMEFRAGLDAYFGELER
jgi:hypothetical protein